MAVAPAGEELVQDDRGGVVDIYLAVANRSKVGKLASCRALQRRGRRNRQAAGAPATYQIEPAGAGYQPLHGGKGLADCGLLKAKQGAACLDAPDGDIWPPLVAPLLPLQEEA